MIEGIQYMGNNVRDSLRNCSPSARIYPLAKIVNPQEVSLGDHAQLFDFCFVDGGNGVTIGEHSTIAFGSIIEGKGATVIGNRVLLGVRTTIISGMSDPDSGHVVDTLPHHLINFVRKTVTIEDDAVVGACSTLLPGAHVARGVVLGANSLLMGKTEPFGVYVGSPAKFVRMRRNSSSLEELG